MILVLQLILPHGVPRLFFDWISRGNCSLFVLTALYGFVAAANYNRPKPIDPIWYRKDCFIRIHCACGRHHLEQVGQFARVRGISPDTLLHQLIERLRCTGCGSKPNAIVTRYKTGN
ncbi:hypothetical protein [Xanthomonas campestris]|uniref:hypothetical protein n=1 Tax=Xanthomonas campestris TaxID=339 RepID=UPI00237936CC|nr:hypothetical protein [Xanthomonas campestris]